AVGPICGECASDADPVPGGRADLLPVAMVVFAGLAVREAEVQDRGAVLGESHFGVSSECAGGLDRVGHAAFFRFMASHSMAAPSSIQGHSPPDLRVSGMCRPRMRSFRSEEHTSELQSRFDLVCRLLLEKKKAQMENARQLMYL